MFSTIFSIMFPQTSNVKCQLTENNLLLGRFPFDLLFQFSKYAKLHDKINSVKKRGKQINTKKRLICEIKHPKDISKIFLSYGKVLK